MAKAMEKLMDMKIGLLWRKEMDGECINKIPIATGARFIIMTGCINTLVSRISGTFMKNNSCID